MWTGLLSLNAFCRTCKSTTGEMAPKEGPKLAVGTRYGSVHVYLGLVVEYWSFVGACTRHSLMNSMKKIVKTAENQPLSTCPVSCTKAN